MRPHPTGSGRVGMSSVSFPNIALSASMPLARLMSETCTDGRAAAAECPAATWTGGGMPLALSACSPCRRCRSALCSHRDIVLDRQARQGVQLGQLQQGVPGA